MQKLQCERCFHGEFESIYRLTFETPARENHDLEELESNPAPGSKPS